MNFANLLPGVDEHSFIAGKTRSGKTYLATKLVIPFARKPDGSYERRKYLLSYDAKATANIPGATRVTTFRDLYSKAQHPDKFPWLLYAPVFEELNDRDLINAFFKLAYQRGKNAVHVTELSHICKGAWVGGYPEYLEAILKRGAELHVPFIGETQEPTNIAPAIISQSNCVYAFHQKMKTHREKIASVIPLEDPQLLHPQHLKKQHFYFYRDGDDEVSGPHRLNVG